MLKETRRKVFHFFMCLNIYLKRNFYLAFPFGEGGTLAVTDGGRKGAANAAEVELANKSHRLSPTRRLRRHPV
jgi:hypothetical protein